MPCCCCDLELENVIDLISFIIEYMFGLKCIKRCLKKSPDQYRCLKFFLRLMCLIIGIGFDLLSFYISYPSFFTGYNNSYSILEANDGSLVSTEKGIGDSQVSVVSSYILGITLAWSGGFILFFAPGLYIGCFFPMCVCIFSKLSNKCFSVDTEKLKKFWGRLPDILLKCIDFAWSIAVLMTVIENVPRPW